MIRIILDTAGTLVLLTALVAGPARAGPLSYSALFGQFNAIIFGNFDARSEIEGVPLLGATSPEARISKRIQGWRLRRLVRSASMETSAHPET